MKILSAMLSGTLAITNLNMFAMQTEVNSTAIEQTMIIAGRVALVSEIGIIDKEALQEKLFAQHVRTARASKKYRLNLQRQYEFYKKSNNIFLLKKAANALTVLIATTLLVKNSTQFVRDDKVRLYEQYNRCFEKIRCKIDALKRAAVTC